VIVVCFRAISGCMRRHSFLLRLNSSRSFSIGRSKSNSICIAKDIFVSRSHAKGTIENGKLIIEDSGSKNGTYVNGKKITTSQQIALGASFKVGESTIRFDGLRVA